VADGGGGDSPPALIALFGALVLVVAAVFGFLAWRLLERS
jgi:hypothetical protein